MDISGALFCTLCQESIDLAQKKTELECNHTFHTRCFIIYVTRAPIQCTICRVHLITDEVYDIGRAQHHEREQERKQELYTELTAIPGFVEDIKKVKKQIAKVQKTTSDFRRIGQLSRREFRIESLAMQGILQRIILERKKRLLESEESEKMSREKRAYLRIIREFNIKYHPHTLAEVISIPQFKINRRVGYYWFSRFPRWMIRRWFSLKLQ
jgi:hypothetical protein